MPHRRAPHPNQLGFSFEMPLAATGPAELAGLESLLSRTVSTILKEDPRAREIIAAEMSVLLDEDVSRAMLDAYASPAREGHKVIASRLFALVAVTARYDQLDKIMRRIGAALLVGEEVKTARLGQVERQIADLKAERERLIGVAPNIGEGSK